MKNKTECVCDRCNKIIFKYKSQIHKHNFCSRQCLADYSSKIKNPENYMKLKNLEPIRKAMSETNRKLNSFRMTPEVKEKIRLSRLKKRTKDPKSYYKFHGKHIHRIIAEEILQRPLEKGEIVHHLDGNKHNNLKENLFVFKNQSEHAKWHAHHKKEVIDP